MISEFFNFDNITRQKRSVSTFDADLISLKNENSVFVYTEVLKNLKIGPIQKYPIILPLKERFKQNITSFHEPVFGMGSDGILKDLFFILNYKSIQILEFSYKMAEVYNQLLSKEIRINKFGINKKNKSNLFKLTNNIVGLGGDVLYLVNPHCPTGFYLNAEQIRDLSHHFKHIIVDEAYTNPFKIDWDVYNIPNVIIVKSFSKLGGAPGIRLGYCITGDTQILEKMQKISGLYEISTPAAHFLNWLLDNPFYIEIFEMNLKKGFNFLQEYATFSLMCGNFALLQPAERFLGPRYEIDGEVFTRVTLTDEEHASQLILA